MTITVLRHVRQHKPDNYEAKVGNRSLGRFGSYEMAERAAAAHIEHERERQERRERMADAVASRAMAGAK